MFVGEAIEILSCNITCNISTHVTFSYVKDKENAEREIAAILFPSPIRVEFFDDERNCLSIFGDKDGFTKLHHEIPGLERSTTSKYLKTYISCEPHVPDLLSDELVHYCLWTYGGGVLSVLTEYSPTLTEM